jgi:hypothetical protein
LKQSAQAMGRVEGGGKDEDQGRARGRESRRGRGEGPELPEKESEEEEGFVLAGAGHHVLPQGGGQAAAYRGLVLIPP